MVVIVLIAVFNATTPRYAYGSNALALVPIFCLWVPLGALPTGISLMCGLGYASRDPGKRGSARWPVSISLMALLLAFILLGMVSGY